MDILNKSAGSSTGGSGGAEVDSMEMTIKKLLRTLESVSEYVDKVTKKEVAADADTIQLLQNAMSAAPRLPASAFEKIFTSQVQDMLVVVYLANLTRAQLALAEKLQSVAISSSN